MYPNASEKIRRGTGPFAAVLLCLLALLFGGASVGAEPISETSSPFVQSVAEEVLQVFHRSVLGLEALAGLNGREDTASLQQPVGEETPPQTKGDQIPLPRIIQGARKSDDSVDSTPRTITMSAGVQVGKGSQILVELAENWRCDVNCGPSPSGPWKTIASKAPSGVYGLTDDYLSLNLEKLDAAGEPINVSPDRVPMDKAISLYYAVEGERETGATGRAQQEETPVDQDVGDESEFRLDTPQSQGAANLQKRARQMVELQYTFAADLTHYRNSKGKVLRQYRAGDRSEGMLYSSTRDEELFVPQSVSFHTFMTALRNPNSYFYTRQSKVSAQKLYYGAVCSTVVDYCYGIDYSIPTTYMLEEMEGMTRNRDQSANGLMIGDLISKRGKHVAVVTDILRSQKTGEVAKVYITEAGLPVSRTRAHTPEEFQTGFLDRGFSCFRWSGLDDIDYESTPWINLDGETEKPVYSTHLSPRRGDKANWRAGETVEVDILDAGGYTGWKLWKDDEVFQTGNLSGPLLSFPDLDYGSYRLCLTQGSGESESVYWIVVDTSERYTDLGNGTLRCDYSSANAVPASLNWNYNPEYEEAVHGKKTIPYAIFKTDRIDAAGPGSGQVEGSFEPGTYDMRVAYRTEYGLFWSDTQTVTLK